jgi:hypothetical protein
MLYALKHSRPLITFAGLLLIGLPALVLAQPSTIDSDSDILIEENQPGGDFWKYEELDEDEYGDTVTESFEYIINTSHRFANWVDGFFDDDRTVGIKNETRLKLSAWGFWEEKGVYDDSDFNLSSPTNRATTWPTAARVVYFRTRQKKTRQLPGFVSSM